MSDESDRLDREALAAIRQYTEEHGFPPSLRDIGDMTGKSSSATVKRRVGRLRDRGWITVDPTRARSIVIVPMKTETEDL